MSVIVARSCGPVEVSLLFLHTARIEEADLGTENAANIADRTVVSSKHYMGILGNWYMHGLYSMHSLETFGINTQLLKTHAWGLLVSK